MTTVSLKTQPDYQLKNLKYSIRQVLEPLGGLASLIKRGDQVLLKPNLVLAAEPEKAVTTHPAIIKCLGEDLLDLGAKLKLGDSPGISTAFKVARKCGIEEVAKKLNIEIIEFTPQEVENAEGVFKNLTLAKELIEADKVINLPKLKTHGQMVMTMAVKNLFGAVVGKDKVKWHYRAGTNKDFFATLINEVFLKIAPQLNIMDAIVAMDGNGPTNGNPNSTGFIAASPNGMALDYVLAEILDTPAAQIWT